MMDSIAIRSSSTVVWALIQLQRRMYGILSPPFGFCYLKEGSCKPWIVKGLLVVCGRYEAVLGAHASVVVVGSRVSEVGADAPPGY